MTFQKLTPARDTRSQVHPSIARRLHAIYTLMGFDDIDDFDRFWADQNLHAGNYIPPDQKELDFRASLIARAMNGEAIDTKAIYHARTQEQP
jgi:hypothetical protein